MSKKHSTQARINEEVGKLRDREQRRNSRGVKSDASDNWLNLDRTEVISLVCKYFCRGKTATEIVDILLDDHDIEIKREQPYKMLSRAASLGWLKFQAPLDLELTERLEKECGSLDGIEVVHSASNEDVAHHAALAILRQLRKYKVGAQKRDEVHIGFAGGPAMRKLARNLADMLCRPQPELPQTIYLHALVAGFNPHDPTTDPNAFFTYFVRRPGLPHRIECVGLHAPALIKNKDFAGLKRMVGIKEAYAVKADIDIFVTSGSDWQDEHSLFKQCMQRSDSAYRKLESVGCVGDILWRPLGARQPIEVPTEIRAMTLVELSELPNAIAQGKQVVLLLGSCGGCDQPKGRLLRAILNQKGQLITHLVADTRTVLQALDAEAVGSAG